VLYSSPLQTKSSQKSSPSKRHRKSEGRRRESKTINSIKQDFMMFFVKYQKMINTGSESGLNTDEMRHLNLIEIKSKMESFESLLNAAEDDEQDHLVKLE
jgi:hypothetical protein